MQATAMIRDRAGDGDSGAAALAPYPASEPEAEITPEALAARATPAPWILRAAGAGKSYGAVRALSDARLSIAPGEAVAIMGPSGSGKSTLLHVLAGIVPADSGSVVLRRPDGSGHDDLAALDDDARSTLRLRRFGFVFQQGLLIPELTAVENVALPLLLIGSSRADAFRRAEEALSRLGLTGLGTRRIGQLSGGEAQRVAIARALVARSSLMFADEPTGARSSATDCLRDRDVISSRPTESVELMHDYVID